jgi:hypothetical protein
VRRTVTAALGAFALIVALAVPASAHSAPPCNDADGDGAPSGREYAAHHIVPLATAGALGAGGHVPGSHGGFSLCLDVH